MKVKKLLKFYFNAGRAEKLIDRLIYKKATSVNFARPADDCAEEVAELVKKKAEMCAFYGFLKGAVSAFSEEEMKELNRLFDTIFLDLYPTFIDDFNALMPESERFHSKTSELLSTELRIFALIRLGINDSSQIADILHYSLATIYNYRTRVRNKALIPAAEFENAIMRIGVIE